jgi:hypothetical protein
MLSGPQNLCGCCEETTPALTWTEPRSSSQQRSHWLSWRFLNCYSDKQQNSLRGGSDISKFVPPRNSIRICPERYSNLRCKHVLATTDISIEKNLWLIKYVRPFTPQIGLSLKLWAKLPINMIKYSWFTTSTITDRQAAAKDYTFTVTKVYSKVAITNTSSQHSELASTRYVRNQQICQACMNHTFLCEWMNPFIWREVCIVCRQSVFFLTFSYKVIMLWKPITYLTLLNALVFSC